MIIECTNPICGQSISVPQGANQVVCQSCNTWHFVEENEDESSSSYESEILDYGIPQEVKAPEKVSNNEPESMLAPSNYDDPIATSVSESISEKEETSLGHLVTLSGEKLGLKEGKNSIGRQNTDIIINAPTVSRRHCILEVNKTELNRWEYIVYDIGHLEGKPSLNGVFVKGRSLRLKDFERIELSNGDFISVGKEPLTLHTN